MRVILTPASFGQRAGRAEGGETAKKDGTELEVGNLTVGEVDHEALTQKLHAPHLRLG